MFSQPSRDLSPQVGVGGCHVHLCIYLYMSGPTNSCNGSLGLANSSVAAVSQRRRVSALSQLSDGNRSPVPSSEPPLWLPAAWELPSSLTKPEALPSSDCWCEESRSRHTAVLLSRADLPRPSPGSVLGNVSRQRPALRDGPETLPAPSYSFLSFFGPHPRCSRQLK